MPRSLNRALLIGNLGADPEHRTLESGRTTANLSLATSVRYEDRDGKTVDRTEWHRVVLWGRLADIAAQYAHKGSRVYVDGEIRYRSYEDAAGVTKYVTEIHARELILLDAPPAAATEKAKARAASATGSRDLVPSLGDDDDIPW